MKTAKFTTLGTVLLASALPVVGAVLVIVDHPRAATSSVPELMQSQFHVDVRTLGGTISHQHGQFIFREDHLGMVYFLDDQRAARKFSGKSVWITGTVDAKTSTVHVHKIELT
jgi:hypothetical protein